MQIGLRPKTPSRLGLVATAGLVLACGQQQGLREGEILHPTAENALPEDAALITRDSLPVGLSPTALDAWKETRAALLGSSTVLRLGAEESGPEVFGRVWDAAVASPSERLVVLDEIDQDIRVFDRSGRFIGQTGGIGDGPTEFRYANGIEVLGDGRLVVSSRGSAQLKVLAESESGWELEATVQLPAGPDDLCSTPSGRVFISGYKREGNTLVHEVAVAEGSENHDFADGYVADHWLIEDQLGSGRIACAEARGVVAFAYELLPWVRAFDLNAGRLLWSAGIEEFLPPMVVSRVRPDGRHAVRRGRTEVEDGVAALHSVSSDHLLLQISRLHSDARRADVRSYLLDVATGLGASLGGDVLPPVVSTFPGGYVAVFEDPYPRLEVRVLERGR